MAKEKFHDSTEAEETRGQLREVVGGIRERYLQLGALVERVATGRLFKPLGYKCLKAFLDEECDVTSGPSAPVARRINHFLSVDAKEALGERKQDYERLARACHSVASEKLTELSKHKDLVNPDTLDEIVGNLENLPTKQFKSAMREMRDRAEGRSSGGGNDAGEAGARPGASRKGARGKAAEAKVGAEDAFDLPLDPELEASAAHRDPDTPRAVRVVRKTFTVPREAEETIERALAIATRMLIAREGGNADSAGEDSTAAGTPAWLESRKDLALVEMCRLFERLTLEKEAELPVEAP